MKMTYIYSRTKEVYYCGVRIQIDRFHDWIATDSDGTMYSYLNKPVANESTGEWLSGGKEPCYIGDADLQDTDWRETLEYVGDKEEDQF